MADRASAISQRLAINLALLRIGGVSVVLNDALEAKRIEIPIKVRLGHEETEARLQVALEVHLEDVDQRLSLEKDVSELARVSG